MTSAKVVIVDATIPRPYAAGCWTQEDDELARSASTWSSVTKWPGFSKTYVGALQEIAISWTVDHHTTVRLLGAYCEAGPFLRETCSAGKEYGKCIWKSDLQFLTVLGAAAKAPCVRN
jgi:hypothetical protein